MNRGCLFKRKSLRLLKKRKNRGDSLTAPSSRLINYSIIFILALFLLAFFPVFAFYLFAYSLRKGFSFSPFLLRKAFFFSPFLFSVLAYRHNFLNFFSLSRIFRFCICTGFIRNDSVSGLSLSPFCFISLTLSLNRFYIGS